MSARNDASRSPSNRTETALTPYANAVGTAPTTSSGTNHSTCAPSIVTCTRGAATGRIPTSATSVTVSAPTSIAEPARLTGGRAMGRAVSAKYAALPMAATNA